MRLLAIGDIHGHLTALDKLLESVAPTESDTLIFLGDYVDKGPNVAQTIERLVELASTQNWIFLRGNHDQMFLDACLDSSQVGIWETLAGEAPLRSYGKGCTQSLLELVPDAHIDFLQNRCQNFYESDSFIFVHGGIRPHLEPSEEEIYRLQWMVLSSAAQHLSTKTVVCGHSAQESGRIVDLGHTICIDTGISKGGFLTCLDLTNFRYVQASADGEVRSGCLRAG